ncbi:Exodeoxyribonuclease III [Thermobifida fusca YX]|uniref:Exodeoxyribonuclease III n=1 Tax=Thermobifida fusca (strain YX) TaxID=269800 RepID=Q47TC1_THEFY|nr:MULTISPECIES: exodeoxyribonuclease III [Thermobifida]AAZ54296.1 Exodeoxyribonuclease III [Thermobifida fusca YX]MBO2529837.1 exodeoxyribonuclease III [Thermobifida sp.]PZN64585.1 MAG: exodeoxyribonuclease III [Thermobifida fusca]QOS59852.1 exodeoxyribonuclease III [Thermobifida fusca]
MRLATWNVNSVRARSERIAAWLRRSDVDVVALQETKCRDDQFPTAVFTELGYEVAHHGLSQWNGVAIASRVGLSDVQIGFPGQPGWGEPEEAEARAISAVCGGVRVWSLYVPNGREIDHPHYTYKLQWLARLREAGEAWLSEDPKAQIALCGDWNIAPYDEDVWDMAEFEGRTHVTKPERDAFHAVVDAGFTDVVRPHAPGPGVYTYWDYKGLAFPKRKGMRIDFILASPALAERATDAKIDREERKGKGASDHAPVIADFQLD